MLIESARLALRPFSPRHLLALIDGYEQFKDAFGLPAAAGLREFYVSGDVSPAWLEQLGAATAADIWVHGFAVVHRPSQSVIGTVGFKGPPDGDGMVEIAYGIAPPFQLQGFATEAATAAIDFVIGSGQVQVVRAHTLPTANPSTCVLAKCGFEFIGDVVDPEDGPVWRWERDLRTT